MKFLAMAMWMAAPVSIETLGFMSGCWQGQMGPLTIEEQWSRAGGGMMMGMSRNIKGGRTVFSEFMRIEPRGGELYYIARIGDAKQSPTPFKLVRANAAEAVFENLEHDFPQRIIYRVDGDGLKARIEGKDKGKERGEDYPMKAVGCKY